jgi:hypothetical protein
MERERGPIEKRLHELIRDKGLASPALLEAQVSGVMPTLEQRMLDAEQMNLILMEALLELAREVDDLRASL